MALYLLELPATAGGGARINTTKAMIVEADSLAKARLVASAQDEGDSNWSDSTGTTIAAGVASDYEGFVYRVRVGAASSENPDTIDVSYTGVASDTVDLVGAALRDLLLGSPMAAAVADDGGSFTDETTEANEDTADDMTLYPATPAQDDAYYFGSSIEFDRMVVNVSTAGAGTYTLAWEYWDGDSWETLTGVTEAFKSTGLRVITFTNPSDWATTTINSQGPFFYIRAVIDNGTTTTVPLAARAYTRGYTSATYTSGSNTLLVAAGSGVDDLGDRTLSVEGTQPDAVRPIAELVGTITDGGASTDDLTVVIGEPTAIPAVLRKL